VSSEIIIKGRKPSVLLSDFPELVTVHEIYRKPLQSKLEWDYRIKRSVLKS
jgi:hypothetical protein